MAFNDYPNNTDKPKTVSDLFPSKYLSAEDLRGNRYTLKIVSADVELLRGIQGEHYSAVLTFESAQKRLVLNKTQAQAMAQITKTEVVSAWAGKRIMLSPGRAHNGKPTIVISAAPEAGTP